MATSTTVPVPTSSATTTSTTSTSTTTTSTTTTTTRPTPSTTTTTGSSPASVASPKGRPDDPRRRCARPPCPRAPVPGSQGRPVADRAAPPAVRRREELVHGSPAPVAPGAASVHAQPGRVQHRPVCTICPALWFFFIPAALYMVAMVVFALEQHAKKRTSRFDHEVREMTYEPEHWASVDIFLPTAGEPLDVLTTPIAMCRLEWPGGRVRVGARRR